MKIVAFFSLSFLLLSCQDDTSCCINIDVGVDFMVKSEDGADLLNPASPDAFSEDDIWLYYLTDGEPERYYKGNLDAAKGFSIYPDESLDAHVIRVFPNTAESEEFPVTYIQWDKEGNNIDTLRCEFQRTENSLICTRVWFNGELKRSPTITKMVFEVIK
ncbi:MAG: hypothetical protein AAF944_04865 [Bacteroidota bacterium]